MPPSREFSWRARENLPACLRAASATAHDATPDRTFSPCQFEGKSKLRAPCGTAIRVPFRHQRQVIRVSLAHVLSATAGPCRLTNFPSDFICYLRDKQESAEDQGEVFVVRSRSIFFCMFSNDLIQVMFLVSTLARSVRPGQVTMCQDPSRFRP